MSFFPRDRRQWITRVVLPTPFFAWALYCIVHHAFRWEHLVFVVVVPVLAWTNARTQRLFLGLLPIGLLAIIYDAMRLVRDVGVSADRVHLCDLRAIDMRLFGFTSGGTRVAVQDWFQAHASPVVDVICAIPYGTFIYVSLAVAVWLYFKDYEGLRRYGWTFLLTNLAGFATYHIYPAAPPWYFHAHGCVVDMTAHASEGPNLARVDAMFGMHYFAAFYGRSSDVFGAVPSLHVTYPLLNLLFGWKHWGRLGRTLASVFFGVMCFAAVYLDHHWVVDVLIGVAYTFAVHRLVRWVWAKAVEVPQTRDQPALAGEPS